VKRNGTINDAVTRGIHGVKEMANDLRSLKRVLIIWSSDLSAERFNLDELFSSEGDNSPQTAYSDEFGHYSRHSPDVPHVPRCLAFRLKPQTDPLPSAP
jgi:hypothetical protein